VIFQNIICQQEPFFFFLDEKEAIHEVSGQANQGLIDFLTPKSIENAKQF
jgi:hypothetical protein